MLEKFHDALVANDDRLFFNEDFSKVAFFPNQMDILAVDLDKINLGQDNSFDENDTETIIDGRVLAWCIKFEKRKTLTKMHKQRINASSVAS